MIVLVVMAIGLAFVAIAIFLPCWLDNREE